MTGLPLIFTAPFVLAALAALPVIWLLLRVTPPAARRIAFPPLRIFADLAARREQPARTPWWLLLLRLMIAALIILACSGPLWNPPQALPGKGPLLVLVDNGFPAARDWATRVATLEDMAQQSFRADRPFAFVALAETADPIEIAPPEATRAAINGLQPAPNLAERAAHLPAIEAFLKTYPETTLVWLSDGITGVEDGAFLTGLKQRAAAQDLTIIRNSSPDLMALAPTAAPSLKLSLRILRPLPSGRNQGTLSALDNRGQIMASAPFLFPSGATVTETSFEIPTEIRNNISRVEITAEKNAGAVILLDERNRRRTVGIASGATLDQAQPLLSPTYYLQRALQPYADIREGKGDGADAIGALTDQHVNALILADTGSLDSETTRKLNTYVENGGLLIRFAGSRLASGDDALLPVKLRRGDRALGSALSWSQPKKLAAFSSASPYYGLGITDDVVVNRQVLAEPTADLDEQSWATLEDGTPLVTAEKRGKGMIVLFHVTATPSWSSLPLSGLFVDMLRRTIQFGQVSTSERQAGSQPLAPRLVLNGYGDFTAPAPTATAIPADYSGPASAKIAPGFYGPADAGIAINALTAKDVLSPLDDSALGANRHALTRTGTIDLRGPLFLMALILFLLDSLMMVLMSGKLSLRRRTVALLACAFFALPVGDRAMAQPNGTETAALETRIAHVITGDSDIDTAAKAGLTGLGQFLRINTSFEPADPVGIDPERDELAFYPLIYWPISPSQPFPSDKALRNLNAFMKNGGTILFDTRDALRARPGMAETPETAYLRRLLASLDVPQLEPVPGDHVLTKTFFLLEAFPGRYDASPLWTEVSARQTDGDDFGPVRVGDGVSPVLVTGNDFAAAWAIGPRNETLYPVTGSDPRQREIAFRSGVNIVLYTLTGNYKSDQVHVEDLLQRLGRQGAR